MGLGTKRLEGDFRTSGVTLRAGISRAFLALIVSTSLILAANAGPAPAIIDQTTPRSTVASYLNAIAIGDAQAAVSLLAPYALDRGQDAGWLDSTPAISDIEVGEPRFVDGEIPTGEAAYAQILDVPVTFDLQTSGSDGFSSGLNYWGYRVVRNSDNEPWQISSSGV